MTDAKAGRAAEHDAPADAAPAADRRGTTGRQRRAPLYPRLLRLRTIAPSAWQRALLGEGSIALAVVLVLADLTSAWTLLALPVGVALVVKAHDVLAGLLATAPRADDDGAAPRGATPSDEQTS